MFEALIFFALIPLALGGLAIVLTVGWLVLPYFLVALGGGILALHHYVPDAPIGLGLGGAFTLSLGLLWASERHGGVLSNLGSDLKKTKASPPLAQPPRPTEPEQPTSTAQAWIEPTITPPPRRVTKADYLAAKAQRADVDPDSRLTISADRAMRRRT